jgi:hypothetical protein
VCGVGRGREGEGEWVRSANNPPIACRYLLHTDNGKWSGAASATLDRQEMRWGAHCVQRSVALVFALQMASYGRKDGRRGLCSLLLQSAFHAPHPLLTLNAIFFSFSFNGCGCACKVWMGEAESPLREKRTPPRHLGRSPRSVPPFCVVSDRESRRLFFLLNFVC